MSDDPTNLIRDLRRPTRQQDVDEYLVRLRVEFESFVGRGAAAQKAVDEAIRLARVDELQRLRDEIGHVEAVQRAVSKVDRNRRRAATRKNG